MSMGIGITDGDSLERLAEQLQRLSDTDLYPLALDLREAVIEGNRQGLLAGLDGDGKPFSELQDSTYERGRGGLGPPLIPRFSASQLIDRFRAEIQPSANGGVRIKASWPGVKQVRYFKTGTRNKDGTRLMARRDPTGIRPETKRRIAAIIAAFKKKMVAKF